jgi:hypothetical protein
VSGNYIWLIPPARNGCKLSFTSRYIKNIQKRHGSLVANNQGDFQQKAEAEASAFCWNFACSNFVIINEICYALKIPGGIMRKRQNKLLYMVVLLVVPALACNLLNTGTPNAAETLNPLYTAAAQTLAVMAGEGTIVPGAIDGYSTPNGFATPTISLLSSTPYPPPIPVNLCNAAAFIKDITIPDGSTIAPGTAFTKTWRIKNVGTCKWTSSYALVFVTGDMMAGSSSVNLSGNVNPGETVDLSINLTAPNQGGHYRSYWKLRTSSGTLFGIGAQAETAFWVDLNVAGPEYTAYDFVARACNADWKYNNGGLPCPGSNGDDRGYVLKLNSPRMEDGTTENQPGLLTVPKHTANGYIQGRYPTINIQAGDRFLSNINCQYNAKTCDVLFRLEYRIDGGQIKTFREWHEVYEGNYYPVDLDLSSLAGKNVKFYLTILANNSKGKDYALWLAPRIVRQGTAPPTPTASNTPTATSSYTASPTNTETPSATP